MGEIATFLDKSFTEIILLVSVLGNCFLGWLTYKSQIRQIRPKVITHGCRVSGLQVYTFFDKENKMSEPVCVYLDPNRPRD